MTKLSEYHGPKVAQIIDVVLTNGQSKVIEGIADKFRIVTSDGELLIRSNLSPQAPFTTKQGVVADDSNLIERLEILNSSGATVTFRLFFGFGDFLDGSANVLGTVSISPLPAGISTAALQTTGNTSLASIDSKLTNPLPVSAAALPLPAGASTEATLAAQSAKLPAALDEDGRLSVGQLVVGAQGNAWNAAVVGVAGTSAAIDTKSAPNVSAFGNASAATTISIQVSQDNANFYDTTTNVVLGGAGNFHIAGAFGAKYIRLKSSLAATITATIAAK